MKQSTVIFGGLLGAFVIYITVKGQLPNYLSLFSSNNNSSIEHSEIKSGITETTGIKSKLPPEIANKVDEVFRNMGLV